MRGETAVAVVAGHELLAADGRAPCFARWTLATWNHSRDDHGLSLPMGDFLTGRDHPTDDFMPEYQWQGMARRNAIECISDVGVADAASRDLDHHLVWPGLQRGKFLEFEALPHAWKPKSVGSVDRPAGFIAATNERRVRDR